MKIPLPLIPLTIVLFTGCHLPRYAWDKPGGTPEELQRDAGACKMLALQLRPEPMPQPAPVVNVYTAPGYNNSALDAVMASNAQQQQNAHDWNEVYRQRDFYRTCMMSKGWTLIRTQ